MDKQRADRKWFADNAKRIDKLEAQVREQTKEAMECARAKCVDIDGRIRDVDVRLRAELDDNIPKLSSGLEAIDEGSPSRTCRAPRPFELHQATLAST